MDAPTLHRGIVNRPQRTPLSQLPFDRNDNCYNRVRQLGGVAFTSFGQFWPSLPLFGVREMSKRAFSAVLLAAALPLGFVAVGCASGEKTETNAPSAASAYSVSLTGIQ